jgi:hypothetical protein
MTPAYAVCRPYRDVQDRLLCRQDLSRMYLAHLELESKFIILIVIVVLCAGHTWAAVDAIPQKGTEC